MRRIPLLLATAAALWMSSAPTLGADEPAHRYEVVTPKDDGIIATAINGKGEVVGFQWIEEEGRPGVLEQRPFFARGKAMTYLPKLEGYTATFPAAVSDDGLVVGRASKPAPFNVIVALRNQAFVWDAEKGIRGLGVLENDTASFACGIARDGRRISGFSVGLHRLRACVWDRAGDGWKASALPHSSGLGSNVVALSGDGRRVAAVDGLSPCLWTQGEGGDWTREAIGEAGSLIPRAVNDGGTVAGLRHFPDGRTQAVVWTRREGLREPELPEGYVRSEASALNNRGVVVGMVDGPRGSKIGPHGFVYEAGRLRLLDEGGPSFVAATAINDRGQVAGVLEAPEEE